MTTTEKVGIGVLAASGLIGLLYLTRKTPPTEGQQLYAGMNSVMYYGLAVTAREAFASIEAYLEIVYEWEALEGIWVQVMADTIMKPNWAYQVSVSQDCLWTY